MGYCLALLKTTSRAVGPDTADADFAGGGQAKELLTQLSKVPDNIPFLRDLIELSKNPCSDFLGDTYSKSYSVVKNVGNREKGPTPNPGFR